MPRGKQGAPTEGSTGLPAAETADIARLVEDLDAMLSRLRPGSIPEPPHGPLDEADRMPPNLREALPWPSPAEVLYKQARRLSDAGAHAPSSFRGPLEWIVMAS